MDKVRLILLCCVVCFWGPGVSTAFSDTLMHVNTEQVYAYIRYGMSACIVGTLAQKWRSLDFSPHFHRCKETRSWEHRHIMWNSFDNIAWTMSKSKKCFAMIICVCSICVCSLCIVLNFSLICLFCSMGLAAWYQIVEMTRCPVVGLSVGLSLRLCWLLAGMVLATATRFLSLNDCGLNDAAIISVVLPVLC